MAPPNGNDGGGDGGDARDRLIRVEERQREILRRIDRHEEEATQRERKLEALGHAGGLLEYRIDDHDKRIASTDRVVKRVAWIVISWAIALVLSTATFFLKLVGSGNGSSQPPFPPVH